MVLRKYREAFDQKKLLQLTFTTLSEYLWLLRSACQALAPLENKAVLYLAAAVSDFYIPSNEMVNISSKFISYIWKKERKVYHILLFFTFIFNDKFSFSQSIRFLQVDRQLYLFIWYQRF